MLWPVCFAICFVHAGRGDNINLFESGSRLEAILETGGAGGIVGSVHPLSRYQAAEVFVRVGGVCTLLPEPATLLSHVGPSVDLLVLPELILLPAGS